ncbi:hypothetical protein PIB30_048026 [Stylosanthes scabra]|uniref:Uncharacterized protein n=1 Tax=Stylosanthes scabra TaxID=79078 RepID=A0ABU6YFI4_9FABA|nr:hypothetical protein [Stylosanthes scabra]
MDLTSFLPIVTFKDQQLRSFAHFNPQPRHYGNYSLLAEIIIAENKMGSITAGYNCKIVEHKRTESFWSIRIAAEISNWAARPRLRCVRIASFGAYA